MDVRRIGVIGAGTMGSGIAQAAAVAGFQVFLFDTQIDFIDSALHKIANRVARDVRRGRMVQNDADVILGRIKSASSYEDLAQVDYVIEAATEIMEIKQQIFRTLDSICPNHVVFASNTSGLSITEMAAATNRAENVIGTHFFNPVPSMKLVEIVTGARTSPETVAVAEQVCRKMGKECIAVKEAPLFVVNRILVPMINEAIFVYQEGLASAEDIDKGMVLGANLPMGPLALADFIGLDTLLLVTETLFQETGDTKYRPPVLLRQMVRANMFGKKSGQGFYVYEH